ncbi:hypothetical protein [Halospeciosus flavus]|uniref:Uncharacterized protein n=1 Tax=Halospeciosus flavus TaxID=3032283 RepID=A0ABD5Z6I7_9EURY|nr:hypothetical protein [Halospeciosus flavus]
MPGTPDPVLGSDALTFAVAAALGIVATTVPIALEREDRLPEPWRLALGGGVVSALGHLTLWSLARDLANPLALFAPSRPLLVGFVVLAVLVLGAQTAIPWYCYARWRLRIPLVVLFGATTLVVDSFLHVHGETDPLGLYTLFFGPVLVVSLGILATAELLGRKARKSRR